MQNQAPPDLQSEEVPERAWSSKPNVEPRHHGLRRPCRPCEDPVAAGVHLGTSFFVAPLWSVSTKGKCPDSPQRSSSSVRREPSPHAHNLLTAPCFAKFPPLRTTDSSCQKSAIQLHARTHTSTLQLHLSCQNLCIQPSAGAGCRWPKPVSARSRFLRSSID